MVDMSDIEELAQSARRFAVEGGGVAQSFRMFDGIADLLVEVIRELGAINEKLAEQAETDA